jgi:ribosomal protein L32
MSDVPYATEKDASYENFMAKCPSCGYTNIFNRVTDLRSYAVEENVVEKGRESAQVF